MSNFMEGSEFDRAINNTNSLIQQMNTEFGAVEPYVSEFDRAMSDTQKLMNGLDTLCQELASEPGGPHDELQAELDRITNEVSQGAAEVIESHKSESPYGEWGVSSSTRNIMDMISSTYKDVAKLIDPSTSDEECDRITRRTLHHNRVMGGMNASDSIRNSVGQSNQDLIWQNAQHQSQVNFDTAEIQRNSNTDAMQQAVTQGDADAAAKAADAAAQSNSQMDYYRNMMDIYKGNA
jgi:hypothetical protein